MLSCEFWKVFKNTFLTEHLRTITSKKWLTWNLQTELKGLFRKKGYSITIWGLKKVRLWILRNSFLALFCFSYFDIFHYCVIYADNSLNMTVEEVVFSFLYIGKSIIPLKEKWYSIKIWIIVADWLFYFALLLVFYFH